MEIASLTATGETRESRRHALVARAGALPWPWIALGALTLATAIGFFVYPTYPTYDSYYALLWGREVLHGTLPTFDAYRAPTEHPLAVALGAVLSLAGGSADRIMVGLSLASFVVLAAGLYRLARASFGMVVGLIAAALVCTRLDFPFLAARAYIDIPYLALVIWAAALEAERPRRGVPVLLLLTCAGLMRPEAWVIAGLYFLWIAAPASWPQRIRYALLTVSAPLIWVTVDTIVTGHPLFSLTHTNDLADELGRQKGLGQVPSATAHFLLNLDKLPVLVAAIAGFAIAVVLVPKRLVMPLILLVIGFGTFLMVALAGLSVIDRYLLVPSLMAMVFAAVTIGGWSMLRPGVKARPAWAALAAGLVIFGVVYTFTHVTLSVFDQELRFRGESHRSLEALLANPRVRAAMKCGPVSVPNHKLVPDTRWVLNAGADEVIARSDPKETARARRGVAILTTNRLSLLRQGFDPDDPSNEAIAEVLPPPGFKWIAATAYYGAYARC